MWNRPHLIALDEPTNYLDNETLRALVRALKAFKGAVMTISHNAKFVSDVSNEKWELAGGQCKMLPREDRMAKGVAAAAGADGGEGDEEEDADE